MLKAKVLVLGPCESGKTTISNFLSDATETFGGDYHPTQGVRIVEFEVPVKGKRSGKCEVELWDCSGDHKFEACWPAIARDVNGVLFVFNPEHPNYDKDLESWYECFQRLTGCKEANCFAIGYYKSNNGSRQKTSLPESMRDVQVVQTSLDDDAEQLRDEFHGFIAHLSDAMSKRSEQEELNIMNSRG